MPLAQIKEEFQQKMKNIRIAFTALNHDEKHILTELYSLGIKTFEPEDSNLLIHGDDVKNNPKIEYAKHNNINVISVTEFRTKYMYNHSKGDLLNSQNIGVTLNYPYGDALYLLNPKQVTFSNSLNKKVAKNLNLFFAETENIEHDYPKIKQWLDNNPNVKIVTDVENI